jgi:hypothetical protein
MGQMGHPYGVYRDFGNLKGKVAVGLGCPIKP